MMFDLQVLAYQADITRVFTMLHGRETSPRTYRRRSACPSSTTPARITSNNPELMARKAKIDQYHVQLLRLLPGEAARHARRRRLAARPLDDSLRRRAGQRQPARPHEPAVLVAGGGAGTLKGGRHLAIRTTPRWRTCSCRCWTRSGCRRRRKSATAPSIWRHLAVFAPIEDVARVSSQRPLFPSVQTSAKTHAIS